MEYVARRRLSLGLNREVHTAYRNLGHCASYQVSHTKAVAGFEYGDFVLLCPLGEYRARYACVSTDTGHFALHRQFGNWDMDPYR